MAKQESKKTTYTVWIIQDKVKNEFRAFSSMKNIFESGILINGKKYARGSLYHLLRHKLLETESQKIEKLTINK